VARNVLSDLSKVPLFSECSDKDLRMIASSVKEVEHPEGRVVVREGQSGVAFFLIAEGTAKVTVKGRTRAKLGPGDSFGEISLLDGGARTATVTATSPLVLYGLSRWVFNSILKDQPDMIARLLAGMAGAVRRAESGVLD
jgi:glutaminase